jgi:hypothetical protein
VQKLERENEAYRKAEEGRQREAQTARYVAEIDRQVQETSAMYPGFDFGAERQNPEFENLVRKGVSVRAAYEVIHRDEIIGGAMKYAATEVQRKTADDIRARGQRPAENGLGAQAPSLVRKANVDSLTREDRDEIARRVARGERIVL